MSEDIPNMKAGMLIDQALYLEMLYILVEEGVISKEKAVHRYNNRKKIMKNWE